MIATPRTVRLETVQKLAARLKQRNEQITRARILHTNDLNTGRCSICDVKDCPTFVALQDPPPVHRWMPEPRSS